MQSKTGWGFFGCLMIVLAAAPAWALPPNFFDESIADDWNQAVGVTFASDGRMFVWEKAGRVWNVENGVKAATPLIDISEEVGDWRDFGLLGFAIDPDFYTNGHIYLLYVVDYHHLIFHGTPNYDPGADWYFQDTIGRLTRYTCNAGDGFRSVNPASRTVLIGESIDTGIPICHQSHGVGSIAFGHDGSLLLSTGDGASYEDVDQGGCMNGSSCTCLSDGIITDKEDVGAFRSQLLDSHSGKILRVDPATGNGMSDNPYYDSLAPRAPRSRVWAMGLRNPFRFTVRPDQASGNVAHAEPGDIYIGDVGWQTWEEMPVADVAGRNFGWPIYEGMDTLGGYSSLNIPNEDAPNPLFGTNQPGFGFCNQQYFYFRNLIVQDTLAAPSFPNPCNTTVQIPASVPKFVHKRPLFDWVHGGPWSRVSTYQGNNSVYFDVDDPSSPVLGELWGGNSSTGGTWYMGSNFPPEYFDTYFHADYGAGWIRQFVFDVNGNPTEVNEFLEDASAAIVAVEFNAADEGLYYIAYDQSGCCMVRRITWVDNIPPTAIASCTPNFGPDPLQVQFTGSSSFDPDPIDGSGLIFEWDFDDGSPINNEVNPSHTYEPVLDITSQGTFTARVFSLNPPHPIGGGSWDPEVMRDGDFPPPGNDDSSRQFDTYHGGDQGTNDWVGYTFSSPREMARVVFQEGKHFDDGGWWDNLVVQVLNGAAWTNLAGVTIDPPYAGNNGISYETYEFTFAPLVANGIRIRGNPGGSANFISVGELRVFTGMTTGPQRFDATLTVTDIVGAASTTSMIVSLNNSPPDVTITRPIRSLHPPKPSPNRPSPNPRKPSRHLRSRLRRPHRLRLRGRYPARMPW